MSRELAAFRATSLNATAGTAPKNMPVLTLDRSYALELRG